MATQTRTGTPTESNAKAIIILLLVVLGGALAWYLMREQPPAAPPGLTDEAREYIRSENLKLSGVEMKANKSYMNQMVVEITGNITNAGQRAIRTVELNCVFYDSYGQVVLRERLPIVRASAGGLPAGATKPFRLPFDTLPQSWNQGMPQLVLANIQFD
jgi:hypothetical protein